MAHANVSIVVALMLGSSIAYAEPLPSYSPGSAGTSSMVAADVELACRWHAWQVMIADAALGLLAVQPRTETGAESACNPVEELDSAETADVATATSASVTGSLIQVETSAPAQSATAPLKLAFGRKALAPMIRFGGAGVTFGVRGRF